MSQNDGRKSLIALQPEQSQGQTCQSRWSSAAAQIDSQSEEFMTLE